MVLYINVCYNVMCVCVCSCVSITFAINLNSRVVFNSSLILLALDSRAEKLIVSVN